VDAIAKASGGVPRTINNLAFNALHKAYTRRQEVIDASLVKEIAGNLSLESLVRPAPAAAPAAAPAPTQVSVEDSLTERVLLALTAAFARELHAHHPAAAAAAEAVAAIPERTPAAQSGTTLTGKLNEKIRCQSWSDKHESRVEINLDRGAISGTSRADRYYGCHFYIPDEEATKLQVGKPIRIRIEQG
jgi:hypothetical protein